MTRRAHIAVGAALALSMLTGCGGPDPTVLLVTVEKRPGVWPIDSLSVVVDNDGQSQEHESRW